MSKKKNNKLISYRIIAGIYIFLNILLLSLIYKLDMLPAKFFLPIIILIIGICFLISFFTIRKKTKKKFRLPLAILSVFLSILLCLANFYILKTMGLFDNMNQNFNYKNYSVYVLKEDNFENLSDLKNRNMGYFANDVDKEKVIEELSSKVDLTFYEYVNLDDVALDLLNGKIDAIVLEDSYKEMLLDTNEIKNDKIKDFIDLTKVIYTFKIKIETKEIKKDVNVREEPFNIYISGIDTYGEVSSVSRSDVNMIVTVNPKTNEILLTSIPRDYYVQLNGTNGYKDKLTHAGMYGIDMSVKTIEDLLDIDINYYVKVNFTSLTNIVNAIGGVDVISEFAFYGSNGTFFNVGSNYVNGDQALEFARERYSFIDGDRQRGKNQQALIQAIFKKCISPSILTKYSSLLDSLNGSFITNMSSDKFTSLIKKQLDDGTEWHISNNSLNGGDGEEYTYSYSSEKLYVMLPYEDSVNEAKSLIKRVINGEKISQN